MRIDDGGRLWIDEKKVIDSWTDQSVTEHGGSIELTKGLHPLRLEYYQGGGSCEVHLLFAGPGMDKQLLTDKHLVTTPWKSPNQATGPGK